MGERKESNLNMRWQQSRGNSDKNEWVWNRRLYHSRRFADGPTWRPMLLFFFVYLKNPHLKSENISGRLKLPIFHFQATLLSNQIYNVPNALPFYLAASLGHFGNFFFFFLFFLFFKNRGDYCHYSFDNINKD